MPNQVLDLVLLGDILYSYQPCESVIWRIVSQRKIMSPDGLIEWGTNFRGETIRHITLTRLMIVLYIEYPTHYHTYLV
jgi:hypothetical protein